MFKCKSKHTKVGCLDDIASVVQKSASMNYAQLVGDQQGYVIVPWIEFFKDKTIKTALKGIKKLSHLRFTTDSPEYVFVKNCSDDSTERKIKLAKDISWKPHKSSLLEVVVPDGLSLTRQWYLYDKICEFCPPDCKDLVCPLPRKRSSLATSDDESSSDE